MDFYISDTHFGHANIIGSCERPWSSVEDMDRDMIDLWNSRVGPDDHVWHLGDFAYRSKTDCANYLKRLNGHKHLIVGNHDHKGVLKQVKQLDEWFESVENATSRRDDEGRRMWMCHYPMMCAPRNHWMLYGHIHNDTSLSFWPMLRDDPTALNCCVEVNGYMPVTFDELVANNERWRREHP